MSELDSLVYMSDHLEHRAALVYSFGPFRLFPKRQLLLRGGHHIKLAAAAFELLHFMVRRHGELLSKDELLRCAWPHTVVHESNLKVNILSLRRSLGDVQARPSYIAASHTLLG